MQLLEVSGGMWLQASRNRGVILGEQRQSRFGLRGQGMARWVSTHQHARAYDSHYHCCNEGSTLLYIALSVFGLVGIFIFWGWYVERREQRRRDKQP